MANRLRPRTLQSYIGQPHIREGLDIAITASLRRGEPLDHVLFHGPPGLGKTTLAHIISTEMHTNISHTSGPALERPVDLVGENHLGEDGAGMEPEPAVLTVEDRHADDVGGQQVTGELDALELHPQGARDGIVVGTEDLLHPPLALDRVEVRFPGTVQPSLAGATDIGSAGYRLQSMTSRE